MPTKSKGAAAALIAAARKGQALPDPCDAALAELRRVIEYNDTAPWKSKVPAAKAIDMLRTFGWQSTSAVALNALCVRRFGRKSYATP